MLPAKMSLMLTLVEALSVLLVLSFQVFQVYVITHIKEFLVQFISLPLIANYDRY